MTRPAPECRGQTATVVYDCRCVLCSSWTQFLVRRDRDRCLRFASMRSVAGRRLLHAHGIDPEDPATFLLVVGDGPDAHAHVASEGVITILTLLGGAWRLAGAARIIPVGWRDRLYRLIARNRYAWCGHRAGCYVPETSERERFLV